MTDLAPVLARLGLSQYLAAFLAEGFETWETVLDITENDFDSLDVKRGHRRKLQREIASTRGYSNGHALLPLLGTPTDDSTAESEHRASLTRQDTGGTIAASSNGGKRKYRRHPKPDENAPERAPSAYVLFSNKTREDLKGQTLSFTEIAKRVGENWQVLSPQEKEPFETHAAALKEKYNAEMSAYRRTEQYAEYMQYLADFKAKNSALKPASEKKRPRMENQPSTGSADSDGGQATPSSFGSLPVGRRRVESIGSTGAPSVSSGRPSPVGSQPLQCPPVRPGSVDHLALGRSFGAGPAARQHSPTPPSPALLGAEQHQLSGTAPAASGRVPPAPMESRGPDVMGAGTKLPGVATFDEQSWPSGSSTGLPLPGADIVARTEAQPGPFHSRRSTRSPPTLRHEETSRSSTSSGSRGSGTTNSSAPSFVGRNSGEGLAFSRGLPPPHILASKAGKGPPTSATVTAPLLPPISGLPSLPAGRLRGPPPPRLGYGPSAAVWNPEEGRLINSLNTVSMHERSHGSSPLDRAWSSYRPAPKAPGHDTAAMVMAGDGDAGSPSSPGPDVGEISPISAILRAGERLAAREAERPP